MKRILSLAIVAMLSIAVSAQTLRFGVRGGLNFCKDTDHVLVLDNMEEMNLSNDMEGRMGFSVGVLVNMLAGRNLELEAEASYSMLGYKDKIYTSFDQVLNDCNTTFTKHYLAIPVVAKYYPLSNGLFVEAGPQVGFLLSDNIKTDGVDMGSYNPYDGICKTFDFAVLGGVGYRFVNNVFVDARYIYGLTKTYNCYKGGKNRNLQISLGYLF